MGDAFPELTRAAGEVQRALKQEEERFAETLSAGMLQFDARMREQGGDTVPGSLVFLLHDTYGFPPDLTADIARERSLNVDTAGYEREMQAQRDRARAASKFGVDQRGTAQLAERSEFCGYEADECQGRVVALLRDGTSVEALGAGERGEVILDRTVFYAEGGGQVGDAGELLGAAATRFVVEDTQKRGAAHSHIGQMVAGRLQVGDSVLARIDAARRAAIRLNPSATHLLHTRHPPSPAAPQPTALAGRETGERRDPGQCRSGDSHDGLRAGDCGRRNGAVRREVRQPGAGAVDG